LEVYELLKKMRIDRGMSQKELAENITSRESIARYENGKNNIPFDILLELLEKLHISMDEFIFYLGKDTIRQRNKNIKKKIHSEKEEKPTSRYFLDKLLAKANKSKKILDVRNYLFARTIDWYEKNQIERKLNKKEQALLSKLMNYLEKADDWGRFEMITFSSLMFLFNTNYVTQRIFELAQKIERYADYEIFHPILSSLYNNAFLLMLERKELKLARNYLNKFKETRHRLLFAMDAHLLTSFYEALLLHLNKEEEGSKQISNIFEALQLIKAEKILEEFHEDLLKFERIYEIK